MSGIGWHVIFSMSYLLFKNPEPSQKINFAARRIIFVRGRSQIQKLRRYYIYKMEKKMHLKLIRNSSQDVFS